MLNHNHDQVSPLQIVQHAQASRHMILVGFTIVFWDHICTFSDEVQFLWSAPRSLVKILFLGNRYVTLACLALAAFYTSRLAHMSDTFCKVSIMLTGCAELPSLAIWDLLLLFRVHALWGKRRDIVVATSILYCITYVGHSVAGILGAVELVAHLHFDPIAKACATDYQPKPFTLLWPFVLFCETVMFILTIIRVIQDRKSKEFKNPLMKSLYYGQIIYNVVIIALRVFNLVVFTAFPPPFHLFQGPFFLWAMISTLVTRMMLHLRRVACSDSQRGRQSLFGETAISTRIVWARRTSVVNSSCTAFSPNMDDRENVDWRSEDGERGDRIELRPTRAEGIPAIDNGFTIRKLERSSSTLYQGGVS